jgi:MFS family permease
MISAPQRRDPYVALRYPEFRNLVLASFLLTIAQLVQEVAIGYELYRITRDPLALGLVGLVEAVPFIALSLFGGHVADRVSKRRILLWSVSGVALASLILQVTARFAGHLHPTTLVAVIYASVFVIGICRAFHSPAASSLRAFLIPVAVYENAATWSSSAWQTGAIVGPMVSGFLYAWVGFPNTLTVVVVLVVVAFVLYMSIRDRPVPAHAQETDLVASIAQGIRFVFRTKIILYSISLDLFSVMFGGVMAILPIYAEDILRVGAQGLGILRAAPSMGAVITLMILARLSPVAHAWRNLLLAVTGFGISILVFAVSPWMLLSVVALFLSGAFDSVSVVIRHTILQIMTPDEMRGRVQAVNGIFLASSNEVGAFESGVAARLMGTVPSAVFGGIATLAIAAWVFARTKDLLKVQVQKP